MLKRLAALWNDLTRHPDPRTRVCNVLALAVASNQPFYPLYVWFVAGDAVWLTAWTFLSTPLFLAAPYVGRRHAGYGRALLVMAGLANTLLCLIVMGPETQVGLFVIPCLLIAALAFTPRSLVAWPYALMPLLALAVTAFALLSPALNSLSGEQAAALARLNLFSILGLSGLISWLFWQALRSQGFAGRSV